MTTLKNASAMQDLYERLEPLGFEKKFVRKCILPEWWQDKLAEIPANRAYVESILSRQLGIELTSLANKDSDLEPTANVVSKFKQRRDSAEDDLSVAQILGWRVATSAALSFDKPYVARDLTASSIRQHILSTGANWVGLDELLDFCWSIGIPVIHLRRVPDGKKNVDGMASWIEERPSIVIASSKQQPSWHLFFVAHELGHIACGHVAPGEVNVDKDVSMSARKKNEKEANEFALALLAGNAKPYPQNLRMPNARQLANAASTYGYQMAIDPGLSILTYCHSRRDGRWGLGTAALKQLNNQPNAGSLYARRYSHLDLGELPDDTRHVFECLTEAA